MVAYLTGPDLGPRSEIVISNWDKKIISSSTNKMNIEFKSGDFGYEYKGFSAIIFFTPFPNIECQSWLDMSKKILKSPNYPKQYHASTKCSWLITVDHDYHITLNIVELHVRYHIIRYCIRVRISDFLLVLEIYLCIFNDLILQYRLS